MGFGSIEKHGGTWRVRYWGPDGKRYTESNRLWNKTDAQGRLRKIEREIYLDVWEPPASRKARQAAPTEQTTVGEWVQRWLDLSKTRLKPSTWQNYQETLNRRLLQVEGDAGRLKNISLGALTRRDIAAWFDAITQQFGWQPYNRTALTRLSTALNAACNAGVIENNPAQGYRPPSMAAKRKQLPTAEQLQALVDELPDRYKLLAVLTFFHGLRIGEALALQRKDIKGGGVRVRATVYRDRETHKMVRNETPKTAAGQRVVPIFARFKPYFDEHLKRWVGNAPGAQVFTDGTGEIMRDVTYRTRLRFAKKRAGLDDLEISPHYGRVWLITELAAAGMPIPAIGEILGQKDLATITEIYMRAKPDHVQGILEQVNKSML